MKQTPTSCKNQHGATMVEYGVMVALISIIVLVGAAALGIQANNRLEFICQVLNDGAECPEPD